ncbi:hypothetical protein IAQ61_001438 [Plenodomus lingam]|uniref:uncharacterized protein n=1 Tax=Leptosphaeria maculans TaxID=5022 RepID=UPI00331C4CBF|nr:hypothetical protein IAQ61_001438 [Plenodomus lingam]
MTYVVADTDQSDKVDNSTSVMNSVDTGAENQMPPSDSAVLELLQSVVEIWAGWIRQNNYWTKSICLAVAKMGFQV